MMNIVARKTTIVIDALMYQKYCCMQEHRDLALRERLRASPKAFGRGRDKLTNNFLGKLHFFPNDMGDGTGLFYLDDMRVSDPHFERKTNPLVSIGATR